MKKIIIAIAAVILVVLAATLFIFHRKATAPASSFDSSSQTADKASQTSAPGFNKLQFSTSKPDSIWAVVNKPRPLQPINYVPVDLVVPDVALRLGRSEEQMHIRKQVEQPMKDMFAAAKQAGFQLSLGSGYRSYQYQNSCMMAM